MNENPQGIAMIGFNLGELDESFWSEEAEKQREELEPPDPKSKEFWERMTAFVIAAQAANATIDDSEDTLTTSRIEELDKLLTEANILFDGWNEARAAGTDTPVMCPVTYHLELYAILSVKNTLHTLGMAAIEAGNYATSAKLLDVYDVLTAVQAGMRENVPENVTAVHELSFGEVHSIMSAGLPETYHCEVFTKTDHISRRISLLAKQIARKLDMSPEDYPTDRFI